MGRVKFAFGSINFVPIIDDHEIFWLCKIQDNDGIFWYFTKYLISVTLPYLTYGFLMVFLVEVTPTSRQDSFRLKIIFNQISKGGGAKEDEALGVRRETFPFRSYAIIRLFIYCTSCKRVDMYVCLTNSPSGRPVLSSCSSYSKQVCRVELGLSMYFSSSL
jgi:hypothetical protein